MGVADPDGIPHARERLEAWLAAGYHGDMEWMAERREQRGSPRGLWPAVRSVVMLGMSCAPERDPLANLARPERGTVSAYARSRDYHDVVKGRLERLALQYGVRFAPKNGWDLPALRGVSVTPAAG